MMVESGAWVGNREGPNWEQEETGIGKKAGASGAQGEAVSGAWQVRVVHRLGFIQENKSLSWGLLAEAVPNEPASG